MVVTLQWFRCSSHRHRREVVRDRDNGGLSGLVGKNFTTATNALHHGPNIGGPTRSGQHGPNTNNKELSFKGGQYFDKLSFE